jgi:hypothetical protein
MPTIPDRYYVNLKGRQYPLYEGVLVTASENGLRCLETSVVQVPNEQNGWMAVVMATATFDGPDGRDRVFTDVGDCSPKNCSATIATAALRMASTRAKGRVLRDGIGLGQTLAEEIPDEEATAPANPARPARPAVARHAAVGPARPDAGADAAPAAAPLDPYFCSVCGVEVEEDTARGALKRFNQVLCFPHGKAELAAQRAAAERELAGVLEEE